MHLDPITGLWKNDDNDYQPPKRTDELEEDKDVYEDDKDGEILTDLNSSSPELHGKCVLSVRFNSVDDHARWNNYVQHRQWDFAVTYPAFMQATYDFHNALEVEVMAKKIVQLLQQGFDVHSASWKLEKKKEEEENEKKESP